jgi:hypothetical protein
VSGDPSKRPAPPSPDQEARLALASALLRKAAAVPLADPIAFAALPPIALHALRIQAAAAPSCVDDCLTLASAYAELGIEAQVRVAEITVTDAKTGGQAVHGIPRPYWGEGRFYGHTVIWLPEYRHLIDPAAERYDEIAAWKAGPVVAAALPREASDSDDGTIEITVNRGYLQLAYAIGPLDATAGVVGDPAAQAARDSARHRGVNLASEVVWVLAGDRTETDTSFIPYLRARALVQAARGLERHGSIGEDVFFAPRGDQAGAGRLRLHQIPLPDGTPAAGVGV